jgi:hypothetical protein
LKLLIKNEKILTGGLILSVVSMTDCIDRYYWYRSIADYIYTVCKYASIRTDIGIDIGRGIGIGIGIGTGIGIG